MSQCEESHIAYIATLNTIQAVDTLFSPAPSASRYTEYYKLNTWHSSRHSLLTCIIRFSLSDSPCLFAVFLPWILSVRSAHSALALHMQPHTRQRRRSAHPASKGKATWKAVKTCGDATSAATPGLVCGVVRWVLSGGVVRGNIRLPMMRGSRRGTKRRMWIRTRSRSVSERESERGIRYQ